MICEVYRLHNKIPPKNLDFSGGYFIIVASVVKNLQMGYMYCAANITYLPEMTQAAAEKNQEGSA